MAARRHHAALSQLTLPKAPHHHVRNADFHPTRSTVAGQRRQAGHRAHRFGFRTQVRLAAPLSPLCCWLAACARRRHRRPACWTCGSPRQTLLEGMRAYDEGKVPPGGTAPAR